MADWVVEWGGTSPDSLSWWGMPRVLRMGGALNGKTLSEGSPESRSMILERGALCGGIVPRRYAAPLVRTRRVRCHGRQWRRFQIALSGQLLF